MMTTEVVLDASAILADIYGEPGADDVRRVISGAALSAVNLAEVVAKLIDDGLPPHEVEDRVRRLSCTIETVDWDRAVLGGLLHKNTRRRGISLGDRFCLQLARELDLPVLTTDRRWASLDVGVEVRLIR